jgi:molybdate transport system ATP-binding protein
MRDGIPPPLIEASFRGRLGGFRLDAALSVPASGVTAVFGRSGSGKTTLLRCIAGLERMAGKLKVGDQVWQDGGCFLPPHRRAVGCVFQEPSLLAHLSVRGNLLYGFTRAKARRIGMDEVVDLLGLQPLLERSTRNLSGGERQRVAIGRALLSQPDLMLLDEPLASLDTTGKGELLAYLDRLHRQLAIPMIYVSHDPGEIQRLADRVLLMSEGRIEPSAPAWAAPSAALADQALAGLDEASIRALALAALRAGLSG